VPQQRPQLLQWWVHVCSGGVLQPLPFSQACFQLADSRQNVQALLLAAVVESMAVTKKIAATAELMALLVAAAELALMSQPDMAMVAR